MFVTRLAIVLCALLWCSAATVVAQDDPGGPPAPFSDDYDWMQFRNGEWLKGEIKDLNDDRFVFESDELDELSLDWDDIHAVYSNKLNTLGFRDKSIVEGSFKIVGESLTIETAEGVKTFSRDELRSIIPGRRTELNFWSGKLSLGATLQRGNVDQTDFSALARLERRDSWTRLTLEYTGTWSTVDGEKTADNHRGLLNYDIYLTERLYVRPIRFVIYRDRFQNIAYRLTPSAGLGYDVLDEDGLEWTVGGGIGWEKTRFVESAPGEPSESESVVALFGTRFNWEATSKVDLGLEFDVTVPFDDANAYNFRTVAYAEVDLWEDLDLDVRLTWDRVNDPAPLSDGSVPEQDDIRLYVGIGWSF
jgi:hypothetical protein